jgi:uncharacterized protein DUF4349
MLDDARLASLFDTAGAAFEVPPSGAADIAARAGALRAADSRDGEDGAPGVEDCVPGVEDCVPGVEEGAPGVEDGAPVVGIRRSGRTRRLAAAASRHRVLSSAACVVIALVVAGTLGALARAPGNPTLTSGLARPAHVAPAPGPHATTTVPSSAPTGSAASRGAGGPFSATAPSNGQVPSTTAPTAPSLPDAVGRSAKIEQTGTLGLVVGRSGLGHAMAQLNGLAGAYGGFVANSQTQSGNAPEGAPYGSVTLQVPVDSFTTVLKQAQTMGRTASLTTKATDVTGQYVDLQSRISALQDSRQQYLTIMTKATTVGDVLAVQAQLDTIQEQIEQLQGQVQVLSSETAYSSLTIDVSEGASQSRPRPVPESGVVEAWHDSVNGFVDGVDGVIRVAGPLLFALLCLAALLLGGRALWRRAQRRRL